MSIRLDQSGAGAVTCLECSGSGTSVPGRQALEDLIVIRHRAKKGKLAPGFGTELPERCVHCSLKGV